MTETKIIAMDDPAAADEAVRAISSGGIAVIPTETVYGMAVDPADEQAMKRLYDLKGRDAGKPLARFISSLDPINRLDPVLPFQTAKLARAFFPGPLTLVIEEKSGEKTGFRMPDNRWTLEVTQGLDTPPGVTSANVSGEPPLTRIEDIVHQFSGKVECIIDAGTIAGTPSTVVETGTSGITILREGPIGPDEIRAAARTVILFVCSGNICRSPAAEYFLRNILQERFGCKDLSAYGYEIRSAGTYLFDGYTSPEDIQGVMKEHGIDMSGHRSSPLSEKLLAMSDIVFIMDRSHEAYIRDMHPAATDKVRFLNPGGDIPDPYQSSADVIRRTFSEIRNFVLEASEIL